MCFYHEERAVLISKYPLLLLLLLLQLLLLHIMLTITTNDFLENIRNSFIPLGSLQLLGVAIVFWVARNDDEQKQECISVIIIIA